LTEAIDATPSSNRDRSPQGRLDLPAAPTENGIGCQSGDTSRKPDAAAGATGATVVAIRAAARKVAPNIEASFV